MHETVLLEHMRVPSQQLLDDRPQRVVYGEESVLGRDLCEEDPLENVIADLLTQRVHVSTLNGVDHFVCFFEHEMRQRIERLIAIPRTAVGRPQRPHDVHQLLECLACA